MSIEERGLLHTTEFLFGDTAGTNLDWVTAMSIRISLAFDTHQEMFEGMSGTDPVDPFELGYYCFGDDPVLVEHPEAVVAVFQTFHADATGNSLPLDWDKINPTLKTIALAMDMRRTLDPPPPEPSEG